MARKKGTRLPPFVYITKEMLKSDAFKNLSNASRTAFLLLQAQCCKSDQNEVRFPYSHAEDYMNRHTFARAIKQLIEFGFIEKEQEGGLFRKTNVYSFSDKWRAYKKPVQMAYYIRGVDNGTVEKGVNGQTGAKSGTVGK